jgi:hypothetical protein
MKCSVNEQREAQQQNQYPGDTSDRASREVFCHIHKQISKLKYCYKMSQFSFTNLKRYFELLFESCTTSNETRQRASEEKLRQQLMIQQYQQNELERKIQDLETKKATYVQQRRLKEATEVVREKHKTLKKLHKLREMLDFTETLLSQISDAAMLKDTMYTLSEAQSVFKSIDAPRIYKKFDKLSDQYSSFKTQIQDASELMQDRVADVSGGQSFADDDDLKKELEALMSSIDDQAKPALAAAPVQQQPAQQPQPWPAQQPTSLGEMLRPPAAPSMTDAYASAGLI